MLKLQMLPAVCGDCLWLEYGDPQKAHIVIIDGGLRETADILRARIESACRERSTTTLEVELLVVTHYDNDHILGIIELLEHMPSSLHVKEVWFNGRPQLMRMPKPPARLKRRSQRPADLMGGDEDEENGELEFPSNFDALPSPADLLGPQEADELSGLLTKNGLPWNKHTPWRGEAIVVPDTGRLPSLSLAEGLRLTLLGPTPTLLYKLCTAWADVLGGQDEWGAEQEGGPADLLGRRDTWPPVWKNGEQRDTSAANGSSIMLLAEYGDHALLLAGDGHARDLATGVERLRRERNQAKGLPIAAFKVPHHGSAKNLSRSVLEQIDCSRYLISTDGSAHGHPDHQALLRILRYSSRPPRLMFNYESDTTRPWRDSKSDVVGEGFQDYDTTFPESAAEGLVIELE